MMIESKEDLLKTREEAKREMASYDCRILVCSGTGCKMCIRDRTKSTSLRTSVREASSFLEAHGPMKTT